MNTQRFLDNLVRQAEENPIMALGVAAGLITAATKFIEATSHAKGANAYARYARLAEKKAKQK